MSKKNNLEKYYAARAEEYDHIYLKPERQTDLRKLEALLAKEFEGLDVLEIACGTGYWTQFIARSARKILATDYSIETIQIAQNRNFGECSVEFTLADAYLLTDISGDFSGGFYGFWWSHIPKQRRREFLNVFHSHLASGAKVIMMDNNYVERSSTPISRQDNKGNSFQLRTLEDGSKHQVMKNFPSKQEIENDLIGFSRQMEVTFLDYYWLASYRIK